MKNYLLFSILILLGFSSCDSTFQYDVYVKNSTAENIKVVFKSPKDVNGADERAIELKAGEQKRIISTSNLDIPESGRINPRNCTHVAEYINAFIQETTPSKIKWCDENIKFEQEDIGQWTYTLEYTSADF
ncbi:MAG: hypothetical protein ACI8P3_000411 [Saprospiraceae bacterium]|jgi:hypothetical protein